MAILSVPPDRPAAVIADTAYDADHLRTAIAQVGALAVIPSNPSRAARPPLDRALYKERHLIECCFGRLKQFRRVATRYKKTARNYTAATEADSQLGNQILRPSFLEKL